ncbi:MAG: DUF2470 domain-containing protein [Phycisphaerales bacterium JB041]
MSSTPAEAVRSLRAAAEGHLLADADTVRPVRWVIDRRRGRVVFPMPRELEDLTEAQLLIPEEHDPRLAALLSIETTAAPPAAAEIRHEVYHGAAREPTWAIATIDALRYHGEAFDGDTLELIDPLAEHEPALCRGLNADPKRLAEICRHHAGARVPTPVAVGVDPDGIDVRARFGIVRVEFPERVSTLEEATRAIEQLTAGARA